MLLANECWKDQPDSWMLLCDVVQPLMINAHNRLHMRVTDILVYHSAWANMYVSLRNLRSVLFGMLSAIAVNRTLIGFLVCLQETRS